MITAVRIINVTIIIKMVRVHKVYTENKMARIIITTMNNHENHNNGKEDNNDNEDNNNDNNKNNKNNSDN